MLIEQVPVPGLASELVDPDSTGSLSSGEDKAGHPREDGKT